MNQTPIKLGPLALLLTVISICLTVLAILTFTTAGADVRLAEKYADTVTARYELMNAGQDLIEDAREALAAGHFPEGIPGAAAEADGTVRCELEEEGMKLSIGLKAEGNRLTVSDYRVIREWSEDLDLGNLWPGF